MPKAVEKKKAGTKKAAAQKAVKKAAPRGRGEGGGVRGRDRGSGGGAPKKRTKEQERLNRLAELPRKRSGVTLAELCGPSRGRLSALHSAPVFARRFVWAQGA